MDTVLLPLLSPQSWGALLPDHQPVFQQHNGRGALRGGEEALHVSVSVPGRALSSVRAGGQTGHVQKLARIGPWGLPVFIEKKQLGLGGKS